MCNQATESSNSSPSGGLDKNMTEPSNSGGGGLNAVDLNKARSQQRRQVFSSNNYTSNPSAYQYHSPSPSADKMQLNQIAMVCVEIAWETVQKHLLEIGVFTNLEGKFPLPYYMNLCPVVFSGVS